MGFAIPAAVGAGAAALLMPKPKLPSFNLPAAAPPQVIIPEQPAPIDTTPSRAPLSPSNMSDTAAIRRSRANRQMDGGVSQLILSSGARDTSGRMASGGPGGLVTRTSLLGR